jgi:hypothetical protein
MVLNLTVRETRVSSETHIVQKDYRSQLMLPPLALTPTP